MIRCPDCHRFTCLCPEPKETPVSEPTPPTEKSRRGLDAELQTLAKIDRLLSDMRPEDARRVMGYLMEKHSARMIVWGTPRNEDA